MKPFLDYSVLGEAIPTRDPHELRFNCPYCGDEHYHLYVNTLKAVFHCHKCSTSGKTNVSVEQLESTFLTDFKKPQEPQILHPHKLPPAHKDILPPLAVKYVVSRGIMQSDIERHCIYAASPYSKYFSRLIVPYNPRAGFASYFVARSYTSLAFPKYLNPPGSKDIVFFSPQTFPQDHPWEIYWGLDELVLVEGPFDMIKASRHGPSGAMLGKELKLTQARIIVAGFSRVYILCDNDTISTMARVKIKDLLELHVETKILDCPRKDPGEMEPNDFKELFK